MNSEQQQLTPLLPFPRLRNCTPCDLKRTLFGFQAGSFEDQLSYGARPHFEPAVGRALPSNDHTAAMPASLIAGDRHCTKPASQG